MKLNLEVTNCCNFNCLYCPGRISKRKKSFLEFSLARRVIRQAARTRLFSYISYSSLGEPLLHPQILGIIEESRRQGLTSALATNGSVLEKNTIMDLSNAGLDFLVIGINATTPREFRLRRANSNFTDYLSRIKKALEHCVNHLNMQVILSYISTCGMRMPIWLEILPTYTKKIKTVEFWSSYIQKNMKLDYKTNNNPTSLVLKHNLRVRNFDKEVYKIYCNIYVRFKEIELTFFPYWSKMNFKATRSCLAIERDFTVLSNGECTFCCSDIDGKIGLGNITNRPFEQIFYGQKSEIFRKLNSKKYISCGFCLESQNTRLLNP
jgi:MoaA/NifB/PqqE/SkfB family radical SAM enzyme